MQINIKMNIIINVIINMIIHSEMNVVLIDIYTYDNDTVDIDALNTVLITLKNMQYGKLLIMVYNWYMMNIQKYAILMIKIKTLLCDSCN